MTTEQTNRQLAEEARIAVYPGYKHENATYYYAQFLAALPRLRALFRRVSEAEVELAAKAAFEIDNKGFDWGNLKGSLQDDLRNSLRAALTAIGFTIVPAPPPEPTEGEKFVQGLNKRLDGDRHASIEEGSRLAKHIAEEFNKRCSCEKFSSTADEGEGQITRAWWGSGLNDGLFFRERDGRIEFINCRDKKWDNTSWELRMVETSCVELSPAEVAELNREEQR